MAIQSELLQLVHYLSGLSPDELESIKKFIVLEKRIEKGEIFLLEGEWDDYCYFLISGVVKVYKTSANGREQILHIATQGESLNDVSTFDGGPNAASMLAMTPVLLYGVRKSDFVTIFQDNLQVALNTIKALANRVRRDSTLVKELSFSHVTTRLAKLLLEHAGEETDTWPRLTQQDMAAMVGTSREVVNRSLRTLEENGAIRLERHGIIILKKQALEAMIKASS